MSSNKILKKYITENKQLFFDYEIESFISEEYTTVDCLGTVGEITYLLCFRNALSIGVANKIVNDLEKWQSVKNKETKVVIITRHVSSFTYHLINNNKDVELIIISDIPLNDNKEKFTTTLSESTLFDLELLEESLGFKNKNEVIEWLVKNERRKILNEVELF